MFNKAKHKTRLTQKQEIKHTQVMHTQKQEEEKERKRKRGREKVTKSLGAFFLPHLGKPFHLENP